MSRALPSKAPKVVPGKGTKTVTRTLRIDRDVDEKLADIASDGRVSMNQVANKALRRYVEWEANAEKFGTVTTSASTVKKFFDYLTVEQAKEMGRWWGENQAPGIITFWFKKFDFASVLKALEFLGAQYGRAFTFDYDFDGKSNTLIVKHDMGLKASVFYAEAVKAAVSHLGLGTDMFVTDDQVIAISPPDPAHPLNRSYEGSSDLKYPSNSKASDEN
ncbi:hypothetical protein AUG19_02365 [archaeon 13_1_20CM_2_54_9]|nr:MAG: hypothetical protein AUJ07_10705 [Crenarchaeota archaeon 13_1_40CM_3_53_5]OLE76611.1 MAG: hypothetical protein AUG19_02365 [archaeon 13_1_20CM_2_54_9]TMI33493.1 MAG: hypothetical protein E6H29_00075 [Candidatus Bathyarchaeota archaeon]